MRVLVISRNAWDDTNAIGNTLTNFFQNINGLEIANIYFRTASPCNNICKLYYRTSEIDILKKWFVPKRIGACFSSEQTASIWNDSSEEREKNLVQAIRKYGIKLAYKFSNFIWYSEKWINRKLETFIKEFSPDVVFSFVKSAPQYYLTIKYLRENFNIPLFSWIADDEYTELFKMKSQREIRNLQYILNESSVVKGCSEELCAYYNSVFKCDATPLYKGCVFTTPVKKTVGSPIKVVYAGNLLYGRAGILRDISRVFDEYSLDQSKIMFEIYSNTPMHDDDIAFFGMSNSAIYMGRQPYEIIKQRLAEADIVLHVESFEESQVIKTKYSFSTKIIDCLQSGSVLLAVGPQDVSSIKYIKRIPGAWVIDNLTTLKERVFSFLEEAVQLPTRAESMREFAVKYHDDSRVRREITELLERIALE